jgi:hypothetical protein
MTLVLAGKWRNWSGGQIWAENTNGRRDRWERFQLTGFCRGSAFTPKRCLRSLKIRDRLKDRKDLAAIQSALTCLASYYYLEIRSSVQS